MTLFFEELPHPDSPFRRWDARWKLAALLIAGGCTAILQSLPLAVLAFLASLGLAFVARLPVRWWAVRLAAVAPFLALFVLLLPFLVNEPHPLVQWGGISISATGIGLALLILFKALAVLTLMMVLVASGPLPESLHAAHRLGVPGVVIQIVLLTYRYLFLLINELDRMRIALRLRGFRNRASRHSYRTIAHVTGTLLVRSQEKAERISQAMRSRGFDGQFRSLVEWRTRFADVAGFLGIVAVFVIFLLGDLMD
ncbi:MAG: hypothetical protein KatS3mg105_1973 [Gemmatales bacterium]|nr:MAG: hypothetical protein KatS3mg105_1973 [Gemmatales bacterium]